MKAAKLMRQEEYDKKLKDFHDIYIATLEDQLLKDCNTRLLEGE
jgi:hypothetical protein